MDLDDLFDNDHNKQKHNYNHNYQHDEHHTSHQSKHGFDSMPQIIGGILWICTLIPIGYFLGKQYPGLINEMEYIILGFVLVTTLILIRGARKLKHKSKLKTKKFDNKS